jgi:hypothetical protein
VLMASDPTVPEVETLSRIRHLAAILTLAAALLAIGAGNANAAPKLATSTVKAVPATSNVVGYLCADYGDNDDQCLYPVDGAVTSGDFITVGSTVFRIDQNGDGTVSGANCTPFNNCACDTKYNNHTIVLLAWQANQSLYVRNSNSLGDQVVISGTVDKSTEWVQSGNWYINVAATDDAGVNCGSSEPPYVLTYRPNTSEVWSACGGCYDAAKQNWGLLLQ